MRVVINERLVNRNRKIAQYAFFITLGLLLVGLFVINAAPASPLMLYAPLIILPVAMGATFYSVRMANLWLREPLPDVAIRQGLKGLGKHSTVYHYTLPVRHVLIAPQGVFTFTVRVQEGRFRVEGTKWSRQASALGRFLAIFRQDHIGRPYEDALQDAATLQARIDQAVPEAGVKVQPVVVFTNPRSEIEVIDPAIPTVYADSKKRPSLKAYLRDVKKQGELATLDEAQRTALERAAGIAPDANIEE